MGVKHQEDIFQSVYSNKGSLETIIRLPEFLSP